MAKASVRIDTIEGIRGIVELSRVPVVGEYVRGGLGWSSLSTDKRANKYYHVTRVVHYGPYAGAGLDAICFCEGIDSDLPV